MPAHSVSRWLASGTGWPPMLLRTFYFNSLLRARDRFLKGQRLPLGKSSLITRIAQLLHRYPMIAPIQGQISQVVE